MLNSLRSVLLAFIVSLSSIVCAAKADPIEDDVSQVMTHAGLYDPETRKLFDNLTESESFPIFQRDHYASYYFKNLNENFGNNTYGTCSYVAIGMLLSFYDSYWDDALIPEQYDVQSEFQSDRQPKADFDLVPSDAESPGVAFEPDSLVESLTEEQYLSLVHNNADKYFQFELIDYGMSLFGEAKFDGSDSSLGLTRDQISRLLSSYLSNLAGFSKSEAEVQTYYDSSDSRIRQRTIEAIEDGVPVILRAQDSSSGSAHAMIAYDYDEDADEIYVHTGWRDEAKGISLTHVALSDLPYDDLLDITYIEMGSSLKHSHSSNYRSSKDSEICACSYIYPREIGLAKEDYAEVLPTYEWMSLYREKWYPDLDLRFCVKFLDSDLRDVKIIEGLDSNSCSLTQEEWDYVRFDIPGDEYYLLVTIDESSGLFGSDEYWCRKLFEKPQENKYIPYIAPDEYGFADAYPSDETTATEYVSHAAHNGQSFQTRRYRVGYIHDEYIVLSPVRKGFDHAFIEYKFTWNITRIDVQLARWRDASREKLDRSNGMAEVQAYIGGKWVCQLDLLADSTDLPSNRNAPNTYRIDLSQPASRIRFYAETYTTPTSDRNLGRICIGNLSFYMENTFLPRSGSELHFSPELWTGATQDCNCYSYILNNQVIPGTDEVWNYQIPGEYAGVQDYGSSPSDSVSPEEALEYKIEKDFEKYNSIFGTHLIFKEIGKYETAPEGSYKIAMVNNSYGGFHFYRQDDDGYWSHKDGSSDATQRDFSDRYIIDPETCDRTGYDYFYGFYAVTPWNNLYRA